MSIGSDYAKRPADARVTHPGPGHAFTYRCARCHAEKGGQTGSGWRFVCGLRQRVCPTCKGEIDARRRAA